MDEERSMGHHVDQYSKSREGPIAQQAKVAIVLVPCIVSFRHSRMHNKPKMGKIATSRPPNSSNLAPVGCAFPTLWREGEQGREKGGEPDIRVAIGSGRAMWRPKWAIAPLVIAFP